MIVVKYDDLFVCFIIYIIQLFYLYKRKVKCTHYKTKKKISYQLRTSSMQIRNGSKNIGFETTKNKNKN